MKEGIKIDAREGQLCLNVLSVTVSHCAAEAADCAAAAAADCQSCKSFLQVYWQVAVLAMLQYLQVEVLALQVAVL